jgi:hypothetical protein
MRFLLAGCLILAAGCGAAPPASPPAPLPPSPPPAASASVGPPPVLRLRWSVEEDFVQGAGAQLPVRPLDAPLITAALPPPLRAPFSTLAGKEKTQEKEAASLVDRMEKQAPRARGKEAAALWLAAGWLAEVAGLSAGEKTPLRRAEGAYREAAALVPASAPLGAEARYRLALALARSRRGDLGKTALEELVDTRSDLQPEAAARLGALLERAGAPPEEADRAYLRGIEGQIPAAALVRGALVHGRMVASYRQGKHAVALSGALDFLRGFRGSGPPSIAAEGALRIAADSLEHLGVDDLLARPFAPESAEALLRLAWRAIRREDFPLAERLSTHVLVGAPLGWHAPAALRIAISAADLAPQEVLAQERRARLARDFGPSSPWAEAQRLARGKDGWPSDAVILSSSKPPPPPAEESPEARVEARLRALVRLCLEPLAWRRGQLPESGLTVSLKKTPDSPIRVTLDPDGEAFSGLARCVEKLGPAHLRGVLAGVEAEATWGR